jgi:hypothetical protein
MGNRGDVYERYYMQNFVDKDVFAIFLGAPRCDDFIRGVGCLERHEMAPDGLNQEHGKTNCEINKLKAKLTTAKLD